MEDFFSKAADVLTSPTPRVEEDEFEVTGKHFATKLRVMDRTQRILAEELIQRILTKGQLGTLSEATTVADNYEVIYTEPDMRAQ